MEKIDGGLKKYLLTLTFSWVLIIGYLIYSETKIKNNDQKIKKELESYPFNHSKITDSTLKNGK